MEVLFFSLYKQKKNLSIVRLLIFVWWNKLIKQIEGIN